MSDNDDNSMIGYDPLAWLDEDVQPLESNPIPVSLPNASANIVSVADTSPTVTEPEFQQTASADQANSNSDIDLPEENTESEEQANWTEPAVEMDSAFSGRQIQLDAVQNIQNVNQLHEKLLQALDAVDKIDIDASAVNQIDTATLQLLLVLKRTAVKLQKNVTIDFPSEKFIEAADLLGLSEMLDVDQAAAGFF